MKKPVIVLVVILLASCSSTHKIDINSDNSATVSFSVSNKQSLIDTLLEWGAVEKSDSIIDTNLLQRDLEMDENLSGVTVYSPSSNNYQGKFKVKDIDNLFNNGTDELSEDLKVFSLTETPFGNEFKIQLSIDNYKYLKKSLPILQQESIDMLGPDANQFTPRDEYLEMLTFSLGDNGPTDVLNSSIKLEISVEGTIINVKGGEQLSSNKVLFEIPLIDMLMLKKSYIYSITYK